jgi:hypothetical protein
MPLGNIVDPNTSNPAQNDTWALVTGTTVVNTIISSTTAITSVSGSYDYSVNLHIQGQVAGIGWSYNPTSDTFAAPPPPPPNWIAIVEADFDQVCVDLLQTLSDAGNLNSTDLATAYAYALSDSESTFSSNQLALMNAIYAYIASGG